MREKCQRCSKPATYHITDIERGKVSEYHFCDEHVRQHLAQPAGEASSAEAEPGGALKAPFKAKEPTRAERQSCPYCQITFLEFRNSGRLGCPHDYDVFRDELLPLIENIHDETRHVGKVPRRAPQSSLRHSELIELRKRLKQAIEVEDYETAAQLRDQIKSLETPTER
ncbi:MAG: UvrB/UvrC protein [Isosphaeraceae bacterium]|jgi:protein arginine kinase activator|nr:MAG: UvrB/UvrC protein [Isosphaeraceae bacterium]